MSTGVISDKSFSSIAEVGTGELTKSEWKDYIRVLKDYLVEIHSLSPLQQRAIQREIEDVQLLIKNYRRVKSI